MTYFMDLSPCDYFLGMLSTKEKLKAVGWLSWGHPFPERRTELPEENFRQLLRLLKAPWEPGNFMGRHECDFCFESGWDEHRYVLERFGMVIYFGASNLFLPGKDCVYVAPSMIAHYIDKHLYEPPAEFWQAVLDCPDMQSETYKEALLANGPLDAKWIRAVSDS